MASILQRGNFWRAQIRIRGNSRTRTFDSQQEAVFWAEREEARIRRGATAAQIKRAPPMVTVADIFARYAQEISPEKLGGRWEKIRLRALAPAFSMNATAVDGGSIAEWRDRRLQTVSASTVNRELNLISAVFSRAIKEWRLPLTTNPVSRIQRPKQPQGRTRRVSDDERAAIVKQLGWDGSSPPSDHHEWTAWAFCFSLETAMRQGEILAMRWREMHLTDRYVHLPKTKNGTSRDVPLSSRSIAMMDLLQHGSGAERVVPLASGYCGALFREAVRGACIQNLHFHDARHEATTRLAMKLPNPMDLAKVTGHKDLKMVMRYYHPTATALSRLLG